MYVGTCGTFGNVRRHYRAFGNVRPRGLGMYSLLLGPHSYFWEHAERLGPCASLPRFWKRAAPRFENVLATAFWDHTVDTLVTFGNVRNVWEIFAGDHTETRERETDIW